jgi:hypothetical protein
VWKKKKVKAGVLLYAITIAGIFSLLLQFYLNRQLFHYHDYALNKEKLLAFAMAKRTYEKAISDSGNQSFNMGEVMYHNEEKGFVARVTTDKNYYEFHLPPLKKAEEKSQKKEDKQNEIVLKKRNRGTLNEGNN